MLSLAIEYKITVTKVDGRCHSQTGRHHSTLQPAAATPPPAGGAIAARSHTHAAPPAAGSPTPRLWRREKRRKRLEGSSRPRLDTEPSGRQTLRARMRHTAINEQQRAGPPCAGAAPTPTQTRRQKTSPQEAHLSGETRARRRPLRKVSRRRRHCRSVSEPNHHTLTRLQPRHLRTHQTARQRSRAHSCRRSSASTAPPAPSCAEAGEFRIR